MISEVAAAGRYTGNGVTATFVYPFRITDQTHLAVFVDNVLKTLTTHYTVSGVGDATGSITFVAGQIPANGASVAILRDQPIEQASDYVLNEGFPSARVENDLDKLAMLAQMLEEQIKRGLKFSRHSALTDVDFPEPETGKYLRAKVGGFELVELTDSAVVDLVAGDVKALSNYASFAAAVTAIGATVTTLYVNQAATVSTAITTPTTLHIIVIGSGSFTKSGSGTLTFNGPFEAPLKQVFSGFAAGDVTFGAGSIDFARPEWWGGTSDATSLQKSITAWNTDVSPGTYSITSSITIPSNRKVVFHEGAKITQPSATNLAVFLKNSDQSGGNTNIHLVGVEVDGNKANNAGDVQVIGINLAKCSKSSVTHCKVHNLQGHSVSPPSVGIGVSGISDNCLVAFNDVRDLGDATKVSDGIFTKGKAIRVFGNVVYNFGDTGIVVENSSSAEVVGNDVDANNLGQCIAISLDTTDFNVAGNTCKNAKSSNGGGIFVTKLSGAVGPTRGTLTGNVYKGDLVNGLGRGIFIQDAFDIQLSGNVSENAKTDGIFLQRVSRASVVGWEARKNGDYGLRISGCTDVTVGAGIASSNSQTTPNTSSGVLVNIDGATESTGVVISGIRSLDEQAVAGNKTQAYGIEVLNASEVVIQGNNVSGNRSAGMSIAGTVTQQTRNNKGWVTESSGTDTILNGTTSITVSHNLNSTPQAKDIFVTFTNNPTTDPGNTWISSVTSTQFTVNVRTNPGSNLTFSWRAMVH